MQNYRGSNYPRYFATPHWYDLKRRLLYGNKNARCWVCHRKQSLLIHHLRYDHLFKERLIIQWGSGLFGDVVIVCFDCHTKIHFISFLFFWEYKTPLKKFHLVKRMKWLAFCFYTRNKQYGLAFWAFVSYLL